MYDHDAHETIRVTGRRPSGDLVGYQFCVDCPAVVRELVACGQRTTSGEPCRAIVRDDLGHTACCSHGGKRRVGRRRQRPAA